MKTICYIFTIFIFIFISGFSNYSPLEDKQKQLYYYRLNLQDIESNIAEWNKIISELKQRQKIVDNRIKILSELIDNIKSGDPKDQILKQEAEFINRRERIEKLKNEFKKRILWLYKKGPDYQYKILFTSDSPAKFYARLQYLNKLSETRKEDFAKIKYEELTYEDSKKIKGFRKSELIRFINEKKEDQSLKLLEKMNIDDSLSLLKSNIENLSYQAERLKPKIVELENLLSLPNDNSVYGLKTIPDYVSKNFESLKSNLIFPVSSTNILNDFGKSIDHNTGTIVNNEGIDIIIAENSDVRCVADGIVEDILDIPYFKKMIIVRHSDNYRTIYGIVKNIAVKKNEAVTAGKVIASTSQNLEGQVFHFEIRNGTMPEDPKYWVARVKQIP